MGGISEGVSEDEEALSELELELVEDEELLFEFVSVFVEEVSPEVSDSEEVGEESEGGSGAEVLSGSAEEVVSEEEGEVMESDDVEASEEACSVFSGISASEEDV